MISRQWLLLVVFLCIAARGDNVTLFYLGTLPGGAPEFEKTYDALLVAQMSSVQGVVLADPFTVENLKLKSGFINAPGITPALVEALQRSSNVTTLVMWSRIEHYAIRSKRKNLIQAVHAGSITITLHLYSINFKEYMYIGTFTNTVEKFKKLVFLENVESSTEMTAFDRLALIDRLQRYSLSRSCDILDGIVRTIFIRQGTTTINSVEMKKVPSISDLFDIPTTAPQTIEKEKKK